MNWKDTPRAKKGRLGEEIVDQWLIQKGWVPYRSIVDAAHPFDRLVASADKKRICIVEVKSKPCREKYKDTGFNFKNYLDYRHITETYGIKIFIAFVDENSGKIYGQFLDVLEQHREQDGIEYPKRWVSRNSDVMLFPLSAMREIAALSPEIIVELKSLRHSDYCKDV